MQDKETYGREFRVKIDKVLLATIIVIIILVVILATHLSAQNTVIGAPPEVILDNQTPPTTLVYNITDNQSTLYYIAPEMAWVENNTYRHYPIIVDDSNGNVTFLIISSISQPNHLGYTSFGYYFIANASVTYEVYAY